MQNVRRRRTKEEKYCHLLVGRRRFVFHLQGEKREQVCRLIYWHLLFFSRTTLTVIANRFRVDAAHVEWTLSHFLCDNEIDIKSQKRSSSAPTSLAMFRLFDYFRMSHLWHSDEKRADSNARSLGDCFDWKHLTPAQNSNYYYFHFIWPTIRSKVDFSATHSGLTTTAWEIAITTSSGWVGLCSSSNWNFSRSSEKRNQQHTILAIARWKIEMRNKETTRCSKMCILCICTVQLHCAITRTLNAKRDFAHGRNIWLVWVCEHTKHGRTCRADRLNFSLEK